ncbi:MAG TPA: hypothetical protein VNT99_06560 [Methylomirabilota bacterium]|nr:hypothetical protein [Methylomirabilota bacterium]
MPATYQIEKDKPWLEIKVSGEMTVEELADFTRRMQADPAYSDDLWGIIDCREMTNVLHLTELRGLADIEVQRPGPAWRSKRALLVSSPEQYSTARVFMVFAESSPIQYDVFYNRETAMQWLQE